MGAGPTKDDTYKCVTNHLSDAAGFAAPQNFILAMKEAVLKTRSTESVLDKVRNKVFRPEHASKVRVEELSEDYRWMDVV